MWVASQYHEGEKKKRKEGGGKERRKSILKITVVLNNTFTISVRNNTALLGTVSLILTTPLSKKVISPLGGALKPSLLVQTVARHLDF